MTIKIYSNKRDIFQLTPRAFIRINRYAKWGAVTYLSDMHMLPNETLRQRFSKG